MEWYWWVLLYLFCGWLRNFIVSKIKKYTKIRDIYDFSYYLIALLLWPLFLIIDVLEEKCSV